MLVSVKVHYTHEQYAKIIESVGGRRMYRINSNYTAVISERSTRERTNVPGRHERSGVASASTLGERRAGWERQSCVLYVVGLRGERFGLTIFFRVHGMVY